MSPEIGQHSNLKLDFSDNKLRNLPSEIDHSTESLMMGIGLRNKPLPPHVIDKFR